MTAGYSGTPLGKKLGIKSGFQCLIFNEPVDYFELIADLPLNEIRFLHYPKSNQKYDLIHAFFKQQSNLINEWDFLKSFLKVDGSLWISWPKGSSTLDKDLNENDVRRIGLQGGLVDVKVCAVDVDWSGLKFMYRQKDR